MPFVVAWQSYKREEMKAITMDDESNKLFNTLLNESDRGLVLAGAAFLDDALRELLAATIRGDLSKQDRNQLFTHFGPLSTFSGRTLVAYALNLIDERTRQSLDHLRTKIRNHFAHYAGLTPLPKGDIDKLLDLGEPSIKRAVDAFGISDDPKFSELRVKLVLCVVSLWAKINRAIKEIKQQ